MNKINVILCVAGLLGATAALAQKAPDGVDKNGDGKLSREEAKDRPVLSKHFSMLDTNNDGFLTKDELREGRKAMRESRQQVVESSVPKVRSDGTPVVRQVVATPATESMPSQQVAAPVQRMHKAPKMQDGDADKVWNGLKNIRALKKGV